MTQSRATKKGNIIPSMRYRDAAAAIEWLCKTFGFEKHLVVPGEDEFERLKQVSLGCDVATSTQST